MDICSNENLDSSVVTEESMVEIGKDIIKYSPSKIFGTLANLLLVPIYTNMLSPDQYGLYSITVSVLSFLCIIFSDWVGTSALRFFKAAHKSNNIIEYFSSLLFLLFSNLIIMYILAFILFKPMSKFFTIPSDLLNFVLLLIIPVALRALLFQILRAQIKPLAYTLSVILNQLFTIGIAIYFIGVWHMGAKGILVSMAISIVLIDFIMIFISKMHKSIKFEKIQFNIFSTFCQYGMPIAASSLGIWIITQSNKFVLQYYKGSYYNGINGVGFNLTFSIMLPMFAIITLAAIPRIFNDYEKGKDVSKVITKLSGYYFIIFLPIIMVLCLYSKEIVLLFSNKQYNEAYTLIPFLAVSIFCYGLTEYTTLQYHLAKKTYIDTIIRIIPGIIGVVLSIILIPRFGILGVGVSTLAAHGFYLILSILIKVKNLEWVAPSKAILKCTASLLVGFLVFCCIKHYSLNINFSLQIFLIALSYIGAFKLISLIKN